MNHEETARELPLEVMKQEIERRKKELAQVIIGTSDGPYCLAEEINSDFTKGFWVGRYDPEKHVEGRSVCDSQMRIVYDWLGQHFEPERSADEQSLAAAISDLTSQLHNLQKNSIKLGPIVAPNTLIHAQVYAFEFMDEKYVGYVNNDRLFSGMVSFPLTSCRNIRKVLIK